MTLFEVNSEHWDPDIQQRAIEYLTLLKDDPQVNQVRNYALEPMPTYSSSIQEDNILLRKIYTLKK